MELAVQHHIVLLSFRCSSITHKYIVIKSFCCLAGVL